jgi:hypothetical protein
MVTDSYQQAFDRAVKELGEALEEQEAIEAQAHKLEGRIYTLKELVEGLAQMCGIDVYKAHPDLFTESLNPAAGFTSAVRNVVKTSATFMTPVDVRDELKRQGFKLEKYKNPLASIHTILKRLHGQGEIDAFVLEKKFTYGILPEKRASVKAAKKKR